MKVQIIFLQKNKKIKGKIEKSKYLNPIMENYEQMNTNRRTGKNEEAINENLKYKNKFIILFILFILFKKR